MAGKGQSPYSIGSAPKVQYDLNPKLQMKKYKTEEKDTHQAPFMLPYEMGQLPEYYANIVDNAIQASKTLEDLLKSKEYKNKEDLLKLKKNTEKIVMYLLQNVDATLDKFTIGDNVLEDDEV
jgi:hypothetical protein